MILVANRFLHIQYLLHVTQSETCMWNKLNFECLGEIDQTDSVYKIK